LQFYISYFTHPRVLFLRNKNSSRPATKNPGFVGQKLSVQSTAPRGLQMQMPNSRQITIYSENV